MQKVMLKASLPPNEENDLPITCLINSSVRYQSLVSPGYSDTCLGHTRYLHGAKEGGSPDRAEAVRYLVKILGSRGVVACIARPFVEVK
jgi:hypothetical protein